jgi:hypothetical protein
MNTELCAALLGAIVAGIAATIGGVGLEFLRERMAP